MKTLTILAIITIFTISGCSDFIGSDDTQESRASKPSPADISTKIKYEDEVKQRDSSKSATTEPSK